MQDDASFVHKVQGNVVSTFVNVGTFHDCTMKPIRVGSTS